MEIFMRVFMDINIFSLTTEIQFCHISYHERNWVERKTKCDYTTWNIISGGLALEINDRTLYAGQGDVLLFHPGDTYKAWCHEADHCYFLVTFFSLSSGSTIDLLTLSPTAGLYSSEFVKEISGRFCREYQEHFGASDTLDLGLYAAFLTFFADLSSQFGTQTPFDAARNTFTDYRLQSLLNYITENAGNGATVRSMARFMGMNDKYFSRYFRMHVGMSPKQYLTKCRMTYAIHLLSDSDCSLPEIAAILNFSDQYSFTKAFKNYFGETPGKFRKHFLL